MTKGPPPGYPTSSTDIPAPNRIESNLAEQIPQNIDQQPLGNANQCWASANPPPSSPNSSTLNSGAVPPEYHQIYPPGAPNLPPLPGSVPDMAANAVCLEIFKPYLDICLLVIQNINLEEE